MKLANCTIVVLAMISTITTTACKKDTAPAPEASASGTATPAAPEAPGPGTAPTSDVKQVAADVFIPMPKDIQCSVQGMSSFVGPGDNGKIAVVIPRIEGITCWISGENPKQKKMISIVSTKVSGGLVPTKSFGDFRLTSTDTNIYSNGVDIAIHRDKLQSFRAFLQK